MTSSNPHISPGSYPDPSHAHIGLVSALHLETARFLDGCEHVQKYTGGRFVFRGGSLNGLRIAVVETGPGADNAKRGTHALIDAHQPEWVLSVGFSGSLVPEIVQGDLVVGTSVRSPEGRELAFDLKFQADPDTGLHSGPLLNTAGILRTIRQKQTAHQETGCLAVDLESYAVAEVCCARKTKCIVVRSISDDLTADLPIEALAIFAAQGVRRWGAVAGSVFRRPSSVQDLWGLKEQADRAATSLARFLPNLISSLPFPTSRAYDITNP